MHQTCQGSHLYSKTSSQTTIKALWNTIICNSKGNENILLFWRTYNRLKEILKFPNRQLRLIRRKTLPFNSCIVNMSFIRNEMIKHIFHATKIIMMRTGTKVHYMDKWTALYICMYPKAQYQSLGRRQAKKHTRLV